MYLLEIPTLKAQTQAYVTCEGKPEAFWIEPKSEGGANPCRVPSHNGGDLAAAGRRPATPSLTSLTQAGSTSKPVGTETSSGDKQAKKEKGKKGKKRIERQRRPTESWRKMYRLCDKVSFIEAEVVGRSR